MITTMVFMDIYCNARSELLVCAKLLQEYTFNIVLKMTMEGAFKARPNYFTRLLLSAAICCTATIFHSRQAPSIAFVPLLMPALLPVVPHTLIMGPCWLVEPANCSLRINFANRVCPILFQLTFHTCIKFLQL